MASRLRRRLRPSALLFAGCAVPLALSDARAAAPFQALFAFNGANGFDSQPPILVDPHGNLFGTAPNGGGANRGVVFELSPPQSPGGAWGYSVIHSFAGIDDGADSNGGLVMNAEGVLYGTTYQGGTYDQGTVFSLVPQKSSPGVWSERVLFSFGTGGSTSSGIFPVGSVLPGAGGVLYGTASYGGAHGGGLVYALVPPTRAGAAWTQNVLYDFSSYGSGDGYSPQAGLIADAQGDLYGTTVSGGMIAGQSTTNGTVFELTPAAGGGYTERVIYSFAGSAAGDGSFPQGPLLLGKDGVLYGTTAQGGTAGTGTVFKLTLGSSGWTEQALYSFANNNIDGIGPHGPLAIDTLGRLYGVTPFGGTKTFGTIFRLAPRPGSPWAEAILHDFTAAGDGATPYGLTMDANGTLYGTTSAGGALGDGRWGYGGVFQYVP